MGIIALIYAVLLFFFDLPVWTVFIMLCARGIGGTFQQPAIQSIIPQLVPKDQLVKTEKKEQHFATEIKEGLQVFRKDKKLFSIIVAEALCMFFYAPLSSFYPLMTSDYFNLSAMYGSAVELSFAIGMMVSSLMFSSILKVERKIRASFIGLYGMSAASVLCGVIPPVYAGWFFFAASCLCLGAAGNVHTIPLTAYIQETVAPEKMGRAFSILTLISSVTMPVGLLFSSPIAEKVGVNVWFFISGLCMFVLTTLVLIRYAEKLKR